VTAVSTPPATFKDLCLDATDHHALADWWCRAMGYRRHEFVPPRPPGDPVLIVDPTGAGPEMWIVPVPEPRAAKNRMHHDVVGDTDALLKAGATLLRRRGGDIGWDVLADPEGNEFCCFARSPDAD
jgi:hypothetical protein